MKAYEVSRIVNSVKNDTPLDGLVLGVIQAPRLTATPGDRPPTLAT